jgi:hypothetical protein
MSKVLIVSKTRMANDNVCVGGVDVERKRSLRLMNENGYHESLTECPYNIYDVWELDYTYSNQRPAPHIEDVNVTRREKKGVLKVELRHVDKLVHILKQCDIPVFNGNLMSVFDGKLKTTNYGTLFINEENVPSYSTCFWICDKDVCRSDFRGKLRYNYNDGSRRWGYNISYVGLADAIEIIPKGSLIRLSLAHWWSPEDSDDEERCYLQLSGCFVCQAETKNINLIENNNTNRKEIWHQTELRNFTREEIDDVLYADVVSSQYGNSVRFHLKGGGFSYIPLDKSSCLGVGEVVDLQIAQIVTLSKKGESDIYRIII